MVCCDPELFAQFIPVHSGSFPLWVSVRVSVFKIMSWVHLPRILSTQVSGPIPLLWGPQSSPCKSLTVRAWLGLQGRGEAGATVGLLPPKICTETQNRQSHPKGVPSLSVPQKDPEISHPSLSLPERPPAHPTSLPEPHRKAPPCRACTVLPRHRLQYMCRASIQGLSPGKMGAVQPPTGCPRPCKHLGRARGSGM